MRELSEQFQNPAFRFVKIAPHAKNPIEPEWQKHGRTLSEMQDWTGNIGVLLGCGGLICLDDDDKESRHISHIVREKLPITYTEETGSGGQHFFYVCDDVPQGHTAKVPLNHESRHVGDLLLHSSQSLIAPSIHPNGNPYKSLNGSPIAKVSWAQLATALSLPLISKKLVYDQKSTQPERYISSERLEQIFEKDEKFDALCKGDCDDYPSRSEAEAALLYKCAYYNIPQAQAYNLLLNSHIGKLQESSQAYFDLSWHKANEKLRERKNAEVSKLLDEKQQENAYLDIGFSENQNVFWYGFRLKGRDAVVLSDGSVLRNMITVTREGKKKIINGHNEIKDLFQYKSSIGELAPTISHETVKRFINKDVGEQLVDPKHVYCALRDRFEYFMDFGEHTEISDALACWTIATYCFPLFTWFPHILFTAPKESGKSKCGKIVMHLSFRGFDLGAAAGVTPPQVFRTLECNRGAILIDEFELAKGREASDTQRLVNQILNASAERDSYIIRTEKKGNDQYVPKKFPIYSPKIVCNITGINPTSLSRFIPFTWFKTADSKKGKLKPEHEREKKAFAPLRESLYLLVLENWQDIKQTYEICDIPELKNREADNWIPLFTIAKFVDSFHGEAVNAERQLIEYSKTCKQLEIETGDITGDFFAALYEYVEKESKEYKPGELADVYAIHELIGWMDGAANWIGKTLKRYGFETKRGGKGGRRYVLSKLSVESVCKLYFPTALGSVDNKGEDSNKGGTLDNNNQEKTEDATLEQTSPIDTQTEKVSIGDDVSGHEIGASLSQYTLEQTSPIDTNDTIRHKRHLLTPINTFIFNKMTHSKQDCNPKNLSQNSPCQWYCGDCGAVYKDDEAHQT